MTAAFRSAQEIGYATGTSIAYPTLSGLAANDLMKALFYVAGSKTITTPSGWQQWFAPINFPGGGSSYWLYGYYKIAAGTETTQTFSWTGSAGHGGIIWADSGVDTGTPFDVTTSTASGSSTSLSAPSLTTVTDGALLDWVGVLFDSYNGSQTPPSGFTKRYASPSGQDFLLGDKTMATHGATGAQAITVSSGPWIAVMAALRPAATGSSYPVAGSVAAVSTASASPTALLAAAGTVQAVSAASASPTGLLAVAGSAQAVSAASATPATLLAIAGTAAATSTTAAIPQSLASVAGSVSAVSGTSAQVGLIAAIAGRVDAVSTVELGPQLLAEVAGTVDAVSGVSLELGATSSDVAGRVDAISGVSASVNVIHAIEATIEAHSSTTATVTSLQAIVAVIAAVSAARLTLSSPGTNPTTPTVRGAIGARRGVAGTPGRARTAGTLAAPRLRGTI